MNKTNAMRQLDSAKIPYNTVEYEVDVNDLSGMHVASETGLDPNIMFKTLVAKGDLGPVVLLIPVSCELDLKKCAKAVGAKKLELIAVKELPVLTGYIRGGCSPIGMKKKYPTFIDESCVLFEKITVSAGVRGCQLIIDRKLLCDFISATVCDLTV